MVNIMIFPQELEVYFVIPAIRRELARALHLLGVKHNKIARLFDVSEACVSNYFKLKRAAKINFRPHILKMINEGAEKLLNGECLINIVEEICRRFKEDGSLCELHKSMDPLAGKCGGYLK